MKETPFHVWWLVALLFTGGPAIALADSCLWCGQSYGEAAPGDEARIAALRAAHEASCSSRPTSGGGWDIPSDVPSGPSPEELARQRAIANSNQANNTGVRFFQKGDFDTAIHYFRQALDFDSGNATARQNLRNAQAAAAQRAATNANEAGIACFDQKNWVGAIAKFEEALRHNPNDSVIQGNLRNARGELEYEQEQARKQAALDAAGTRIRGMLGDLSGDLGAASSTAGLGDPNVVDLRHLPEGRGVVDPRDLREGGAPGSPAPKPLDFTERIELAPAPSLAEYRDAHAKLMAYLATLPKEIVEKWGIEDVEGDVLATLKSLPTRKEQDAYLASVNPSIVNHLALKLEEEEFDRKFAAASTDAEKRALLATVSDELRLKQALDIATDGLAEHIEALPTEEERVAYVRSLDPDVARHLHLKLKDEEARREVERIVADYNARVDRQGSSPEAKTFAERKAELDAMGRELEISHNRIRKDHLREIEEGKREAERARMDDLSRLPSPGTVTEPERQRAIEETNRRHDAEVQRVLSDSEASAEEKLRLEFRRILGLTQ